MRGERQQQASSVPRTFLGREETEAAGDVIVVRGRRGRRGQVLRAEVAKRELVRARLWERPGAAKKSMPAMMGRSKTRAAGKQVRLLAIIANAQTRDLPDLNEMTCFLSRASNAFFAEYLICTSAILLFRTSAMLLP